MSRGLHPVVRATKPIVLGVLTLCAAACFLAAARSAIALQEKSAAVSRAHRWEGPLPPPRAVEQAVRVIPQLEREEEVEQAVLQAAPAVKKRRRLPPAPLAPAPAIASSEVEPEDAIRMALRSKRASFERCYEQELKKQASFSGFIVVALSLSASGLVTEARVQEGNRRDAVVGACIVAQLRTMKLPPLTSEADLLIPIRLQAKEPS